MADIHKSNSKPLGALANPVDSRRIITRSFQKAVALASERATDISMLPVKDQDDEESCVGHADGALPVYFWFKEFGKVVDVSRRWLYGRCKMLDGIPLTGGTYPAVAAKILVDEGVPEEKLVPDDTSLSTPDYVNVPMTQEVMDSAHERKVQGYADVMANPNDYRQALAVNGLMAISLQVGDWDNKYVKPTKKDGSMRGWHRVLVFADKVLPNGDIEFTFLNSWGKKWGYLKNGTGRFLWSDYAAGFTRDAMVYTDIPKALLDEAKKAAKQFTIDLEEGDDHPDVARMQQFLLDRGFIKAADLPNGKPTTHFGAVSREGVKAYQKAKGIVSAGDALTTGWGRWGAKTRLAANNDQAAPPTPDLKPKVRRAADNLVRICELFEVPILITDTYRTNAEQDALYAKGRDKNGKVIDKKKVITNAKGGESMHNYGVAFDVVFRKGKSDITYNGDWKRLAEVAKMLGLEWGGDWASFPDQPHFQMTLGYSLADFQQGKIDESRFA